MTDDDRATVAQRAVGLQWKRADLACVAVLVLLPGLFLKEIPSGVPPYGGDILVHVYPLLSLLAHGIRAGRPTLWNFYAAGGYPLAPYSALTLYPPLVLALSLLSVTSAVAALYWFALATLGTGTYLLAFDLGMSRPARSLAALTMAYSGFVGAHVYAGHLFEILAICPAPLAYLLLRRSVLHDNLGAAVASGVVVGLMILAAGLQFLPFALAPLCAYVPWHAALRVYVGGRRGAGMARWWYALQPIRALGVVGLTGVALGAVLLLPFGEILGATLRGESVPYATAATQSLSPGGLLLLVAPNALGNPAAGTYWPASRFGPYFHEIYAYAGLLAVVLAPVALLRRQARPYAALTLVAFVVMLGSHTPLYRVLYDLPGAGLFRAPARAGLPLDFGLALLAGFGLDVVGEAAATRRARNLVAPVLSVMIPVVLIEIGLTLAATRSGGFVLPDAVRAQARDGALRLALTTCAILAACIAAARVPRPLVWALPVIALLDLFSANGTIVRPSDPADYFQTAAARSVQPRDATYRVLALDGAIPPGYGMVTRSVFDVQDAAPLALTDYWRLSHPSLLRNHGTVATSRDIMTPADVNALFLQLFGVRTLFSDRSMHAVPDAPAPGHARAPAKQVRLSLVGRVTSSRWALPGGAVWNVTRATASSLVYRVDPVLPRDFVVRRTLETRSAPNALSLLTSGRIDPMRVAIISPDGSASTWFPPALQNVWAMWLQRDGDNTMTVTAQGGSHGGILVIDDGWFPGWTATVDGRSMPVRRVDYLLKGVPLDPGRHVVRLTYAPAVFLLGAVITLATVALLIAATLCVGAHRALGRIALRRDSRRVGSAVVSSDVHPHDDSRV